MMTWLYMLFYSLLAWWSESVIRFQDTVVWYMAVCSSGFGGDIIPKNHMVDISVLLFIYKNWCNAHQVYSTGGYSYIYLVSILLPSFNPSVLSSVCLFICLCVHRSIHLLFCPLSLLLSLHLSLPLSFNILIPSFYWSIGPSVHPSVDWSISQSGCLSVGLSVHWSLCVLLLPGLPVSLLQFPPSGPFLPCVLPSVHLSIISMS